MTLSPRRYRRPEPNRRRIGFIVVMLCSGLLLTLVLFVMAIIFENFWMILLGLLFGFSAIVSGLALSTARVRRRRRK